MRSSHSRGGFTLIELLVVIAILGLLATMLMPAVTGANDSALKTTDANNLKQLMNMYIKHRTDTRQTWAYPAHVKPVDNDNAGGATSYNGAAATGQDVTLASFWELSRVHEISPDLFNSPAGEPNITVMAGLTDGTYTDASFTHTEQSNWAENDSIPYMLDWSAPKTAGTIRPTLSNRDYALLFGDHINVVFADAHIAKKGDFRLDDDATVIHLAVSPASGSIAADNILDTTGDEVGGGSTPTTKELYMGRGHRKRAHMK